jgi:phospholipase/carboxylesterase
VNSDLSLRYVMTVPSGRDAAGSMPTIVMIHGRGADANDLADLAPMFDTSTGCRFVFPNAPKPFEAYPGMTFGWTWFDGWPPTRESVAASREILLRFLDELTARHPTSSLVIAGFSQGAMMALDVGLRRDVAGIVALSGGLYELDLPDVRSRNTTPVFIAHGTGDDVVPVNFARRARLVLEDAGFSVDYHEYPMAHQVVMEEVALAKDFLTVVTQG